MVQSTLNTCTVPITPLLKSQMQAPVNYLHKMVTWILLQVILKSECLIYIGGFDASNFKRILEKSSPWMALKGVYVLKQAPDRWTER